MEVTRTYLQLTSPEHHIRASYEADFPVARVTQCPPSLYRMLYTEVGKNYRWVDRLAWSNADIAAHLAQPHISLWVLYVEEKPAGYFELRICPDNSTEIAYFGLLPGFIGKGLGKRLLSYAVDRAWETGVSRVWLHTCTLDDPAAMPNYLSRGFRPYKQEVYSTDEHG